MDDAEGKKTRPEFGVNALSVTGGGTLQKFFDGVWEEERQ